MKNNKIKYTLSVVMTMLMGLPALLAQETATASQPAFWDNTFSKIIIVGAAVVVIVAFLTILRMFSSMMKIQQRQYMIGAGMDVEEIEEKLKTTSTPLIKTLTKATPLSKEKEVLLDHDYDGIGELDNPLPPWWVALFWITIIIAIVYWGYYETFEKGLNQADEYVAEMEAAGNSMDDYLSEKGEVVDENTVVALTEDADLARGKEIFESKCMACHNIDGGGNAIGPNLTDNYFIHGGSIKDIFKTIKYGVPEKGMLSWETQLGPADIQKVASYVKSLVGTTPANPKAPQGELYVEEGSAAGSD